MAKNTGGILRSACVITITLAGLVHVLIAPAHYTHAPAHGIFFMVAGLTQCAWAVAFWRCPTLTLYRAGLAVSGGLIFLWLLTLALPAPFGGHDVGSMDASAVVCKVSELGGLVALVALAMQERQFTAYGKRSALKPVGEALVISVLVGVGAFGLGQVAEPWLPQWQHGIEATDEDKAEYNEHDHAAEHSEHDHAEH